MLITHTNTAKPTRTGLFSRATASSSSTASNATKPVTRPAAATRPSTASTTATKPAVTRPADVKKENKPSEVKKDDKPLPPAPAIRPRNSSRDAPPPPSFAPTYPPAGHATRIRSGTASSSSTTVAATRGKASTGIDRVTATGRSSVPGPSKSGTQSPVIARMRASVAAGGIGSRSRPSDDVFSTSAVGSRNASGASGKSAISGRSASTARGSSSLAGSGRVDVKALDEAMAEVGRLKNEIGQVKTEIEEKERLLDELRKGGADAVSPNCAALG